MKQSAEKDLDAISDLLRQPFSLDPGGLEFLVEQLSSFPGGIVHGICGLLSRGGPHPIEQENLAALIHRASGEEGIRRALERSTRKMGRCPKAKRTLLRSLLRDRGVNSAAIIEAVAVLGGESSAHFVSAQQVPKTRLDLSQLSGSTGELDRFVDLLGVLPRGAQEIRIGLGEFTYASGLAVLAQWILANRVVDAYTLDCPVSMRQYLGRVRFEQALRDPTIKVSPDPMDWAVGLTRINRESPTERVTDKIVDILTTFVSPKPADKSALYVLISEMIENIHRHAEAPVDGFAVAQVYPKRLKMGITLVDAGIGVRRSFEKGQPSIDIGDLRSDADFLHAAIRLHATSKSERHSGYGLYLLSELLSRNRGTFSLTSGSATLLGYRRRGVLQVDTLKHRPWQGTIVSVVIDLQRELPLDQIYKEMPLPEGITDDDLFEEYRR